MDKNTWILHIDGDGFFAYCEIARFPHLRGKPVVVGEDRGIVCASTYEAKRLGITRAMPIFKVREQFPTVTILSSHFELYEHYANKLAALLEPAVSVLERYSIDECFALVDFAQESAKEDMHRWLQALKTRVQTATGLTYSFGLAKTKVLAKVASKRQKPDGCTILMPDEVPPVLAETPIESIWGIGWKTSRRLLNMNVKTAADFTRWSEDKVKTFFSLPVQELWHELQGRRMFSVSDTHAIPKSLQSTKSFTTSTDKTFVLAELLQNTDIVFSRMREYGVATNTVTIFLKTKERRYYSTSIQFDRYTFNVLEVADQIHQAASTLFQGGILYRSTGITVWNLRPKEFVQHDLFGIQEEISQKEKIMYAVDHIRSKYGQGSISILSSMPSVSDRQEKGRIRDMKEKDHYIYGLPLPYLGEVQ